MKITVYLRIKYSKQTLLIIVQNLKKEFMIKWIKFAFTQNKIPRRICNFFRIVESVCTVDSIILTNLHLLGVAIICSYTNSLMTDCFK